LFKLRHCPKYQPVLAADYNEEAVLQQAMVTMAASKAEKEAKFRGLLHAMELTSMVTEHLASLPPPSSLPAYVSPKARYEGQMVSTLPGR
jgi:hypothetical protein